MISLATYRYIFGVIVHVGRLQSAIKKNARGQSKQNIIIKKLPTWVRAGQRIVQIYVGPRTFGKPVLRVNFNKPTLIELRISILRPLHCYKLLNGFSYNVFKFFMWKHTYFYALLILIFTRYFMRYYWISVLKVR